MRERHAAELRRRSRTPSAAGACRCAGRTARPPSASSAAPPSAPRTSRCGSAHGRSEVGEIAAAPACRRPRPRVLAAHRQWLRPRAARSAAARAAPSASRRAPRRRPATPAAPSPSGTAAAAGGSAPCRAARRRGRSSRRAAPTPTVSATVICTWSITSAFHSRSNTSWRTAAPAGSAPSPCPGSGRCGRSAPR